MIGEEEMNFVREEGKKKNFLEEMRSRRVYKEEDMFVGSQGGGRDQPVQSHKNEKQQWTPGEGSRSGGLQLGGWEMCVLAEGK